jgi:protease-4
MRNFFSRVFASCLGVLLFFLLLILIFFIVGISVNQKPSISSNAIMHLKLDGEFKEKSENADKFKLLLDDAANPDLGSIIRAIGAAKTDNKIKGIYVETGFPLMGYSSANMLRTALNDFRSSKKFVYSYGEFYTPLTYYIASVSDSIFLSPGGMVEITGYANAIPYFKELSDELGIKWNIFYAGQFKSATEPLRLNKMSDQNRKQLREFYNGLYENVTSKIIKSRKLEKTSYEDFVNNFKGLFAENAVKYKLVDALIYKADFNKLLKTKAGLKENKELKLVSADKYIRYGGTIKSDHYKDKIAVLYMDGEIVNYGKDAGQISPEKFEDAFDDILRKDNIKGVVLRVNSPGGSGSASDEILTYIDRIKAKGKPVIVSMGDYAASGGYYISCHADKIVADSNSLTGSIGVFAVIPELKEMWNDKLKIHFDSVKTHKMSLAISPSFEMQEEMKGMMQTYIEQFYDKFLGVVAKGRKMTKEQVHEVAQGRIWLGSTAKQLGLVDELGNLDTAIKICAEKAKVKEYSLTKYPRMTDNMMQEIIRSINEQGDFEARLMKSKEIRQLKPVMDVINDKTRAGEPQAKMPFMIEFR